jgi:hypothetical protein
VLPLQSLSPALPLHTERDREDVPTPDNDLKFIFDQVELDDPKLGSVVRSFNSGAGRFFRTSHIPLAIFTLEKCRAVATHIHPNGAEELFVLKGG